MERFMKNPKGLTTKLLENYDWDYIELPVTVNTEKLMGWYEEVVANNMHSAFIFSADKMTPYVKQRYQPLVSWWLGENTWGAAEQWTLQWPVQHDGVIPSAYLANEEQFPEAMDPDIEKNSVNLDKYFYGAYKEMYDTFPEGTFNVTRLLRFGKDTGLKKHTDVEPPDFLIRMHVQLQSSSGSHWFFGEDLEREYFMEPGKVYLYNTAIPHAAVNRDDDYWVMIHNNPGNSAVDHLLSIDSLHVG